MEDTQSPICPNQWANELLQRDAIDWDNGHGQWRDETVVVKMKMVEVT